MCSPLPTAVVYTCAKFILAPHLEAHSYDLQDRRHLCVYSGSLCTSCDKADQRHCPKLTIDL